MAVTGKYVLALDQGTTSSRAILFDHSGQIVAKSQREYPQIYPRPGWVEHDPEAIWESQIGVAREVIIQAEILDIAEIAAVGITNQRETTIVWDKATGIPIYNAIVWQDRRTAPLCERLQSDGLAHTIRAKTGLVIDPYFSATKIRWLLDNVECARARAERGELAFGTVDTFLIWRLTEGRLHITDCSNASRTMLFNIHKCDWDEELLALFNIPRALLPGVRQTSEIYGATADSVFGIPGTLPIAAAAGDQQAATFGQACFEPGQAKNTYGTGCFLMMNTGDRPVESTNGLLTTIGWSIGGAVTYCLEGAVFVGGAVIQYLRDSLGIIATAAESESLALSVESNGGVYFVPAFVGLGAPYWDPHARGALLGLTRGSGRGEIARAALESVAYQSRDLLDAMAADAEAPVRDLRVDGGMVANNFLMQFQADILGKPVARPVVAETTALGAAYLAGLAVGFWQSHDEISQNWQLDQEFRPAMVEAERARLYRGWQRAVTRSRDWTHNEQ